MIKKEIPMFPQLIWILECLAKCLAFALPHSILISDCHIGFRHSRVLALKYYFWSCNKCILIYPSANLFTLLECSILLPFPFHFTNFHCPEFSPAFVLHLSSVISQSLFSFSFCIFRQQSWLRVWMKEQSEIASLADGRGRGLAGKKEVLLKGTVIEVLSGRYEPERKGL